jgi:hypothetical protein
MVTNNQILSSLPRALVTDALGNTISLNVNTINTTSADLGNVNTLRITGGNSGEALTTNGNGVLSWTPFVTPQQASAFAPITYVDQVLTNISNVLLSGIATESFVTSAIANIPPADFTGYATETFVTGAIANIPPVDLSQYATQSYVGNVIAAIPPVDFTGYATETFVANSIAAIPPVDFTGYATETFVTSAIANIVDDDHLYALATDVANTVTNLVTTDTFTTYQGDVSNAFANTASFQELEDGLANKVYSNVFANTVANLATIAYVDSSIANIPAPDLSAYATQTYVNNVVAAIPPVDLSPFATITYVDDSIANIPPVDLSPYSTTTEVNGLISTALSGHGNIVSVNLTGNTSQILAGDGTWIDKVSIATANSVSISVGVDGAGQSFVDNEFIHYTGAVKPMLFKNGVFVDSTEYTISADTITFTNYLTSGDQIDVLPTQIASTGGGNVDLTGYATQTFVNAAIANIPQPNLSAYATHQDVADAINLIPSPNLDAYATNTSVDNKIANITFPTYGNVANLNLNGNASTFLSGNGSWQAVSGGGTTSPAGSSTQIQFNNAGAFGASANLIFTDNGMILGNPIPANKITLDKFGSIGARSVNARDGLTASHAEIGEITVNRFLAVLTDGAPVSSTDTGLKGEMRYDTQYMYLCVDDNVWARWALNTTW